MEIEGLEDKSLESRINAYRKKLLPFSYNIVGDLMEAEDIVQETINSYLLGASEHIKTPLNYLIKSVTNKSINQKKLLRSRKEVYPGEWLPVPVFTEEGIYSKADEDHILNYSLLVLLEKLKPRERAVFILKETFDFRHHEIADVLDMTIENSRQLLKRARQKLECQSPESYDLKDRDEWIVEQLADAILNTDVEKVTNLLSENIQSISDGGGKVSAARNILIGRDRVYKFLKAIWHKYGFGAEPAFVRVNHKPAIIFTYRHIIVRCIIFERADNKIESVYIVVNPDKLKALNFQIQT